MAKLVFDYTDCSEHECFEYDVPFEYSSKEQFILDVIDNPMLLNNMNIKGIYHHELEQETLPDFIENIDQYVFTLEEWFDKNSVTKK